MISTLPQRNGVAPARTLAARIARVCAPHAPAALVFGAYEIDFARVELRREGRLVVMQPLPLRVLLFLAEHRDRTVSRLELLDAVWDGVVVCDEALTTAVALARRAIGDCGGSQRVIRTQKRLGYRFVAETRPLPWAVLAPAAAPALAGEPPPWPHLADALEQAAAALAGAARVLRAHSAQ